VTTAILVGGEDTLAEIVPRQDIKGASEETTTVARVVTVALRLEADLAPVSHLTQSQPICLTFVT